MPKVSIIIPVYNVAPYLERCIDSLIQQTLRDIEIICIDDKSTDESLDILQRYAKEDKRIHVIALDKNSGVSIARNKGIDVATGEYLGFIDPDDYIDIDFYEKLYNTAVRTGADITKASIKIYPYKAKAFISNEQEPQIKQFGKWRFRYQWVTALYKHSLITNNHLKFNTNLTSGEDSLFLFECLSAANDVALCEDTLYHYIRRQDSLDAQILPPTDILSKLESARILCDAYGKAAMTDIDYIFLYRCKFLFVLDLIHRNTSEKIKQCIMDTCIDIYKLCHNKSMLMQEVQKTGLVGNKMAAYIRSYDSEGLLKYMTSSKNDIAIDRKIKIYFLYIPILRMRISQKSITFKMFGLKILKIKRYK